jgi:hypothetical protein
MERGPVTKPVDAKAANFTSALIDLTNWDGAFILVSDDTGTFAGTITVQALLVGLNSAGAPVASGTVYKTYGAALTKDKVEKLEDTPPLIKIDVVRTAGTCSVWVQPFNRVRP